MKPLAISGSTQPKLFMAALLVVFTAAASADPVVYAINGSNQFGTMDLASGAFQQIGPGTPGEYGLVQGPNGSLLTLTFSGYLDSINPATGVTSVIGATGLSDCSMPGSPCGPNSANVIGKFGGTIYATDFANNIYTVDPTTGKATLIGPTGMPGVPHIPFTTNPDGTVNVYDESLFEAQGKLYADFDATAFNPVTGAATTEIPNDLYQINPARPCDASRTSYARACAGC